jgi:hypothetical protein
MIGYKMSFSSVGVYTTAKTSLVENFNMDGKIDMIANMATLFGRGDSFGSQVSWANSKPQTRNLAFGELRL